jgi:hypothetical protein
LPATGPVIAADTPITYASWAQTATGTIAASAAQSIFLMLLLL